MLKGKKILLGITGSIAAYKAAILVRELVKAGAEVRVIMTKASTEFITPLTLSTLSKNPVYQHYVSDKEAGVWSNHVELGMWPDVMLVAPASANTIAKMSNGLCDNLLLATYLSAKCPVMVAPAMDLDMYQHPSFVGNLNRLTSFGNVIIPAESGELASGLSGQGRMAEPLSIVQQVTQFLSPELPLSGKKVMVSAGPTYEAIDPVRFIGNHSSGKMGFAIAEEAAKLGASVTLIAGPTSCTIQHHNIKRIDVRSAQEMFDACHAVFPNQDIGIMSAAIADYTPAQVADQKIKKKTDQFNIELVPTKDVLFHLGKLKEAHQVLVGFALETENELLHAKGKLERKNLDFIVLNSLQDKGAGFGHNTNKITLIDRDNNTDIFELKSKQEVALDILQKVVTYL